jgi:hypothetical protein
MKRSGMAMARNFANGVEEIEIEIAEKVEEDNDGEARMIIREWAEKYRTRTGR